jgi:hypothetical protein
MGNGFGDSTISAAHSAFVSAIESGSLRLPASEPNWKSIPGTVIKGGSCSCSRSPYNANYHNFNHGPTLCFRKGSIDSCTCGHPECDGFHHHHDGTDCTDACTHLW